MLSKFLFNPVFLSFVHARYANTFDDEESTDYKYLWNTNAIVYWDSGEIER